MSPQARAAYSPTDPIPAQAAISDRTTAAVRSLFAVVERYPDIKSGANVLELQAEIERIEGIIADRRELYNDQVYRYNTKISTVPAIVLAWLFRWVPRDFFEAEPADIGQARCRADLGVTTPGHRRHGTDPTQASGWSGTVRPSGPSSDGTPVVRMCR